MGGQPGKIAVKVDGEEVAGTAFTRIEGEAGGIKGLEPGDAAGRAGHGGKARFQVVGREAEGGDVAEPACGGDGGGEAGAARAGGAVRFVEAQDVADVGARGELVFDAAEEGGVGVGGGGAPFHGDEGEVGGGFEEGGGGGGVVVVVPG